MHNTLLLAVTSHEGQNGEDGLPYVLHPIEVMARVKGPMAKIVALLHDVIEDTTVTTFELLDSGYPYVILQALEAITKQESEDYNQYLDRVRGNKIATIVKLADISHNLERSKSDAMKYRDDEDKRRRAIKRVKKYKSAIDILSSS